MTTLTWILLVINYFLMMIVLYKPFKKFTENEWADHYIWQLIVWPVLIIGYTIIALIEGFKFMWNNKQ